MDIQACPGCKNELLDTLLYKCVRCFTVYCRECTETSKGRLCPNCKMSQRMLLPLEKSKIEKE